MLRTAIYSLLLLTPVLDAATLRVLPGDVTLTGPNASQRLLVVDADGNEVRADLTSKATFRSSAPAIARVDAGGVVRPVADGEATITATSGDRSASVKVVVQKTKEPVGVSYRNHVTPVLTRAGCNSGACHGALAGKGGFKLSPTPACVLLTFAAAVFARGEAPGESPLPDAGWRA